MRITAVASLLCLFLLATPASAGGEVTLDSVNASVEDLIDSLFEQHAGSLERTEQERGELREIVGEWYTFEEGEFPEALLTEDYLEWYADSVAAELVDLRYIDREPERVRQQATRTKPIIQEKLGLVAEHDITREEAAGAVDVLRPLLAEAKQHLADGVRNGPTIVLLRPPKEDMDQLTELLAAGYYDERSVRAGQAAPEMYRELLVREAANLYFASEMEGAAIRVEDWFRRMMDSVFHAELILGAREVDGLKPETAQYLEGSVPGQYGARPSAIWFFPLSRVLMYELGGDDLPSRSIDMSTVLETSPLRDSDYHLVIDDPGEFFHRDLAGFAVERGDKQ